MLSFFDSVIISFAGQLAEDLFFDRMTGVSRRDLSQRAFAKKVGWTVAKLNELINGKRGVTVDSALDLASALKTTPELWLNLQMYHDLHRALTRRKRAS